VVSVAAALGVGVVIITLVFTYITIPVIIDNTISAMSITPNINAFLLPDESFTVSLDRNWGAMGVCMGGTLIGGFPQTAQNFAPTRMGVWQ